MVSHYPYLLGLTDAHGFSALHHAVVSGEPVFISKVTGAMVPWVSPGKKGGFTGKKWRYGHRNVFFVFFWDEFLSFWMSCW